MTTVQIPVSRGGSNEIYSDDGTGGRSMLNGGHKLWFFPLLNEVLGAANFARTQADNAAGSAVDAANYAATLVGTSVTSLTVGTGSKSLTTSIGKGWIVGQAVEIWRTSARTTRMGGQVTAYSATTGALTVDVEWYTGSGTHTDWTVGIGGARGATGSVADLTASAKTGAYTLAVGDKGTVISCTGTWTLSATAAATLGTGWWCWVENAGTGTITLDPNDAETINGAAALPMRAGSVMLLRCDGTALVSVIEAPRRRGRLAILGADAATATADGALEQLENAVVATGLGAAINRVVWGNSMFVASAGSAANVATSPDGSTWTLRAMPSTANWQPASDGAAQFLATVPGATTTASSTNGTAWSAATALPGIAWGTYGVPVFLGSSAFVLSGASTTDLYRTADNGSTWSTQTLPAAPGNAAPLAVGSVLWYWTSGTTAYTSTTGLTGSWTARTLPTACTGANVWQDFDGALILAAAGGTAYYRTTDGITWTAQAFASPVYGSALKPLSINGVWFVGSDVIGSCASLHAGLWTLRRSAIALAPSTTVRGARNSAGTVFLGTGGSSGGEVLRFAPDESGAALSMFTR